ncbi:hypothetical protein PPYR_02054 [Photinus pyralis]|uniref:PiggyBac transposable element-derived protein domain-containing protein n=1 Tax=Photinus pyralis TaxID=7054 RepID=A0A5N4B6A4_PHOPY|nr:hypothetical protein PPYR_02054 [Photinus pyralis]
MEDDDRFDIESDAPSDHSVHNTDSEQSDEEIEDFVPEDESCWGLYITEEMIAQIVKYTNIYLAKIRPNYTRERDCLDTDTTEMCGFIGLLYMAGLQKSRYLNTKELWANSIFAPACFRLTMSRERFHLLGRAMRFDDINDRDERKKLDNLAPIREIFEKFVNKCEQNYQVGEYCTVDEMLENFRGRCKFRQYIANKPRLENVLPRQPVGPFQLDNSAFAVTMRIASPILNTGRNITLDNYFTSIPLAKELLGKRSTLVGTIKKNKREIPALFINLKRPVPSSMFGFQKDSVLLSYKPKPQKNVLMLSTFHAGDQIDPESGDMQKPEMVTFYNLTKGGVDVADQLKATYSVSRFCCRWPLRLFFTILDVGAINYNI